MGPGLRRDDGLQGVGLKIEDGLSGVGPKTVISAKAGTHAEYALVLATTPHQP
jgi:hypothetical protein